MKLEVAPGARADIHPTAEIGPDTRIQVLAGTLEIGAGAVIGDLGVIVVRHTVRVGANARLGDRVVLIDFAPGYADAERPVREQPLRTAPITVGDGAIVGHGAVLEAGAVVATGARVEAHVVV